MAKCWLKRRGWLVALSVATGLHVGVGMLTCWSAAEPPRGQAQAAGTGGVEIALGPAGRAAGGPETVRADTPAEEPSTPEPEPAPEPESEIEPEPEPEPAPEPEPEPESDPLPVEVSPSQRRCSRRPTPRGKPGP